jgi:hypothetical protein
VWAFGVTAIEVFNKGTRPYGAWPDLLVMESIKEGYRLKRPSAMPLVVYTEVVSRCWWDPAEQQSDNEAGTETLRSGRSMRIRPTFSHIVGTLREFHTITRESGVGTCMTTDLEDSESRVGYASDSRAALLGSGASDSDGHCAFDSSHKPRKSIVVKPDFPLYLCNVGTDTSTLYTDPHAESAPTTPLPESALQTSSALYAISDMNADTATTFAICPPDLGSTLAVLEAPSATDAALESAVCPGHSSPRETRKTVVGPCLYGRMSVDEARPTLSRTSTGGEGILYSQSPLTLQSSANAAGTSADGPYPDKSTASAEQPLRVQPLRVQQDAQIHTDSRRSETLTPPSLDANKTPYAMSTLLVDRPFTVLAKTSVI